MMADHDLKTTATLNMKVVVNETGLKPDTLRAWERRYGLPQPTRTPGGHRLYSQRDVDIVKWLIARQEEGLSISRAVDLWQQLQADGQDPFVAMPLETAQMGISTATGATIDALREEWIEACREFNEGLADQILMRAFALYPPEQVCIQVLMKGLAEIGIGWYQGRITVQQEHLASELATRRLESLVAASPPATIPGKILIFCPPAEEHAFSPLLLTYLLRRNGRQVLFLGANVPIQRIENAIESTKPDLIIMTAQQLHSAATLLSMANKLQNLAIPLAFGGRIFNLIPQIRDRIPGFFLGESLEQAPSVVAQILSHPSPPKEVQEPSQRYKNVLNTFQTQLASIQLGIWQELNISGIPYAHLTIANLNLAQNITAALTLGDISFLGTDIEWVTQLLRNLDIPQESLDRYISAYSKAIASQLGEEGRLISDYLVTLLDGGED
jgi:DNA-binding transcriptional MerR regulator